MAGTGPLQKGHAVAIVLASLLMSIGAANSVEDTDCLALETASLSAPTMLWLQPAGLAASTSVLQWPGSDAPLVNPISPQSPQNGVLLPGTNNTAWPTDDDAEDAPDVAADPTPPSISDLRPADQSTIASDAPVLSIAYNDESGVDRTTARIAIDGVALTTNGQAEGATARSPAPLLPGRHQVVATVRDSEGNEARAEWSFTVALDTAATNASGPTPLTALPGLADGGVRVAPLRFVNGPLRQAIVTPLATVESVGGLRDLTMFDLRPDAATDGDAIIELHLSRAWLADHDAPPDRLVLRHGASTGWEVLPLTRVEENTTTRVVRALVSSFSPFSLAVDEAAPTLRPAAPIGPTAEGDMIQVEMLAWDPSGIRSVLVTLDGARIDEVEMTARGFLVTLGPLESGDHRVTVMATDLAGNAAEDAYTFATASVPSDVIVPPTTTAEESPGDSTTGVVSPPEEPSRKSPLVGAAIVLIAAGLIGVSVALFRKGRTR